MGEGRRRPVDIRETSLLVWMADLAKIISSALSGRINDTQPVGYYENGNVQSLAIYRARKRFFFSNKSDGRLVSILPPPRFGATA